MDVLETWEEGLNHSYGEQSLLLLELVFPSATPEALGRLTIGQRDLSLLRLREMLFGRHLVGVTTCAKCQERIEVEFDADEIVKAHLPWPDLEVDGLARRQYELRLDGWEIKFQLPTAGDVVSLSADLDEARIQLLGLCLLETRRNGRRVKSEELSKDIVSALEKQIIETDPLSNLSSTIGCPTCSHETEVHFDIVSYLWAEIQSWAMRVLREVDGLARAYGWREEDILAMSPWRRQCYLELVAYE